MHKKLYNSCFDDFLKEASVFKLKSIHLGYLLQDSRYLSDYALAVQSCGNFLRFGVSPEDDITLDGANFCRKRLCPMCQWRRSRRLYSQLVQLWERLRSDGFDFLHMVLTVRNCSGDDLNSTIDSMYRNSSRMLKDDCFVAFKGALRFLEVTYNARRGDYHPHLHFLCVVRKSYFTSRYYVKRRLLADKWAEYMRFDYDPIQSLFIGKADEGSVSEVAKYCVKPFDFDSLRRSEERLVYETLHFALHGRRMIQSYGVMRQYLHDIGVESLEADTEAVSYSTEQDAHDTNNSTAPTVQMMDMVFNALHGSYEFT